MKAITAVVTGTGAAAATVKVSEAAQREVVPYSAAGIPFLHLHGIQPAHQRDILPEIPGTLWRTASNDLVAVIRTLDRFGLENIPPGEVFMLDFALARWDRRTEWFSMELFGKSTAYLTRKKLMFQNEICRTVADSPGANYFALRGRVPGWM